MVNLRRTALILGLALVAGAIGCREGRELPRDLDGQAPPDDGTGGISSGTGGTASGAGGTPVGGSGGSGGKMIGGTGGAGGAPLGIGGVRATGGSGGSVSGTGGAPTGTGGVRATGGSGMGGAPAGVGGMTTGVGGMTTGVGGMTTGVGGQGTGGTGVGGANLLPIAQGLDGKMMLEGCLNDTAASVCSPPHSGCVANLTDFTLNGLVASDQTVTLGGTAGQAYAISLHIQGEVEAKAYPGGSDQNSALLSPRADGFVTGGTPSADGYGIWLVRVTNPGSTTPTDYFLNSLIGPGVSNHTTYGVDYIAQIVAQGGATVRLLVMDPNCSLIKNCGPMVNDGSVCSAPIVLSGLEPTAITFNPTFSFTTPYNGEWLVITVKSVVIAGGGG